MDELNRAAAQSAAGAKHTMAAVSQLTSFAKELSQALEGFEATR
jgi:hypothetical protein